MRFLKQSTAIEVKVGVFVDQADGFTAETGLTIAQADLRLAKEGADWAQKNEATTLVHEENGWYRCLLDATDTNTVGTLMLAVNEAGALPVWVEFTVLAANVYDSLIGATDKLQVHADEITAGLITATAIATGAIDADALAADTITAAKIATGAITAAKFAAGAIDAAAIAADAIAASKIATGAITAAKFAAGAIDAAAIGTGAIDADSIAADAITAAKVAADVSAEIADAVWDELKSGHTTPDSFGDYLDDEITSRAAPGAEMNLANLAINSDKFDAAAITNIAFDAGAIAGGTLANDVGTKILGAIEGTVDSATTTTMVDALLNQSQTDYWVGSLIYFRTGNCAGCIRRITAFTPASDTVTFDPALPATPAVNDNYAILRSAALPEVAAMPGVPTAVQVATQVWAAVLETGFDASKAIRIIAAAVAGKVSGGPGSPVFRNLADTQNQITGTADSSGNRSAATYGS